MVRFRCRSPQPLLGRSQTILYSIAHYGDTFGFISISLKDFHSQKILSQTFFFFFAFFCLKSDPSVRFFRAKTSIQIIVLEAKDVKSAKVSVPCVYLEDGEQLHRLKVKVLIFPWQGPVLLACHRDIFSIFKDVWVYVYLSIWHMYADTFRGQKRVWDTLEQELLAVVRQPVWMLGTVVLWNTTQCF